jgi:hypothetical protein
MGTQPSPSSKPLYSRRLVRNLRELLPNDPSIEPSPGRNPRTWRQYEIRPCRSAAGPWGRRAIRVAQPVEQAERGCRAAGAQRDTGRTVQPEDRGRSAAAPRRVQAGSRSRRSSDHLRAGRRVRGKMFRNGTTRAWASAPNTRFAGTALLQRGPRARPIAPRTRDSGCAHRNGRQRLLGQRHIERHGDAIGGELRRQHHRKKRRLSDTARRVHRRDGTDGLCSARAVMTRSVARHPWRMLAVAAAMVVACAAFCACTEGTTPDCSGNPSPCGYQQPPDAGPTSEADGGGG